MSPDSLPDSKMEPSAVVAGINALGTRRRVIASMSRVLSSGAVGVSAKGVS